jgi:hypothetical protein
MSSLTVIWNVNTKIMMLRKCINKMVKGEYIIISGKCVMFRVLKYICVLWTISRRSINRAAQCVPMWRIGVVSRWGGSCQILTSFYSFYFNIVLVALHDIWDKEKRGSKLGSDNFPLIERLPLSATWGRTVQLYWLNAAILKIRLLIREGSKT